MYKHFTILKRIIFIVLLMTIVLSSCTSNQKTDNLNKENTQTNLGGNMSKIYLAAGCFWGSQAYFDKIEGVVETTVGYANGVMENPTYEQVCTGATGHAETVEVVFEEKVISLNEILAHFFRIIDPTVLNRQGNDLGTQYRTGIYTNDNWVFEIINLFVKDQQQNYEKEIVVEVKPLANFYVAEEYHQKYLEKNPGGYCHVDLSLADKPLNENKYLKKDDEQLKNELTEIQYNVTQKNSTELPFTSEFDNFYEKGIYVDIVTGEPLFASTDKYDAGCGWPSFSKPIETNINYYEDDFLTGRTRVEVRSKYGDSHLGHVFNDGIEEKGGLRYCINGASLRFIPYDQMDEEGYGDYKDKVE